MGKQIASEIILERSKDTSSKFETLLTIDTFFKHFQFFTKIRMT